jgi:hypothetical protein
MSGMGLEISSCFHILVKRNLFVAACRDIDSYGMRIKYIP